MFTIPRASVHGRWSNVGVFGSTGYGASRCYMSLSLDRSVWVEGYMSSYDMQCMLVETLLLIMSSCFYHVLDLVFRDQVESPMNLQTNHEALEYSMKKGEIDSLRR